MSTIPQLDAILNKLDGVKRLGGEDAYIARCPAHDDHRPSLSIGIGDEKQIVLYCHAGCATDAILEKIGLRFSDLFPDNGPKATARGARLTAEHYDYHDAENVLLYQVCRTIPKGFFQRRPDGNGGWINGLGDEQHVLYRLPEIIASDGPIYLVEGEKDADRLRSLGLTATTNPMGAGKWRQSYTGVLTGRDVVILPDNDAPGQKHALHVAAELYAADCLVRIVNLPNLPIKGDVSDFLNAGGTVKQIEEIVAYTPAWSPDQQSEQQERRSEDDGAEAAWSPAISNLAMLARKVFADPRWAVAAMIPEGVTVFAGAPKLGKSWFMLGVGIAIACGGKALSAIDVDAGDVLYLALEDTERRLQGRVRIVLQGEAAPERFHYATEWPTLAEGAMEHIEAWLIAHPDARAVIIDTWQRMRGPIPANQSIYSADYAAVGRVKQIADRYGVAIILIHHTRKMTADDPLDTVSGSQGLTGAADTICVLRREIGRSDATLYVRGRDTPEGDHALSFDPETCGWHLLGDAADYRLSAERQAIIDLLRNSPEPMRPKQIAEALGKKDGAIRKLLHMMMRDQLIDGTGGAYRMPVQPGSDGNAGPVEEEVEQATFDATARRCLDCDRPAVSGALYCELHGTFSDGDYVYASNGAAAPDDDWGAV